jgi:hypothetical protein
MTGYEEFQMIMSEIERKKRIAESGGKEDPLQKLKDMFGI